MCARTAKAQYFLRYDPNISGTLETVIRAPLSDLLLPTSYIRADGAPFSNFQFSAAAFGAGIATPTGADILITAPPGVSPERN
jgi:hypothetical protein